MGLRPRRKRLLLHRTGSPGASDSCNVCIWETEWVVKQDRRPCRESVEASIAFLHLEFRVQSEVLKPWLLVFIFSDEHSCPIMLTLRPGRPKVHYCLCGKKKKATVYHLHNGDFYDLKENAVVNWGKLCFIAEMCLCLYLKIKC